MGEHKLKEAGNGDGDGEKAPLSSHIVESKMIYADENCSMMIEEMYTRLGQRAKDEDSIMLNVVQTISVIQEIPGRDPAIIVVLSAQRIGREELERQQRLQRMQGGGR